MSATSARSRASAATDRPRPAWKAAATAGIARPGPGPDHVSHER